MSFKSLSDKIVNQTNKVFGEEVTYTPRTGDPTSIKGIFDNAWVDVEGVVSLRPTLRIRLSDLENEPGKGDEVTIEEVDYRVLESRIDAHGGSTLVLQKA